MLQSVVKVLYAMADEAKMADAVIDIIDICKATGNKHLLWFGKLLDTHFEGIIAHATTKYHPVRSRSINQKIKIDLKSPDKLKYPQNL